MIPQNLARSALAACFTVRHAQAAVTELAGAAEHLPAMGLWILQHALAHDLDVMNVGDSNP